MEFKSTNVFVSRVTDALIIGYSEGCNEVIVQRVEFSKQIRELLQYIIRVKGNESNRKSKYSMVFFDSH